jgi:hypothetical protein
MLHERLTRQALMQLALLREILDGLAWSQAAATGSWRANWVR